MLGGVRARVGGKGGGAAAAVVRQPLPQGGRGAPRQLVIQVRLCVRRAGGGAAHAGRRGGRVEAKREGENRAGVSQVSFRLPPVRVPSGDHTTDQGSEHPRDRPWRHPTSAAKQAAGNGGGDRQRTQGAGSVFVQACVCLCSDVTPPLPSTRRRSRLLRRRGGEDARQAASGQTGSLARRRCGRRPARAAAATSTPAAAPRPAAPPRNRNHGVSWLSLR